MSSNLRITLPVPFNDYNKYLNIVRYTGEIIKFTIANDKNEYILVEIIPEDEDIITIREKFNKNYTSNYLIKITKIGNYDKKEKITKPYSIHIIETPLMYNLCIKDANKKKYDENIYVKTYRDIINQFIKRKTVDLSTNDPYNLFELYDKYIDSNLFDEKYKTNEIVYYLKNNDSRLRICLGNYDKYFILILPNTMGKYIQQFNSKYNNTIIDEYKFGNIYNLSDSYYKRNEKVDGVFSSSHFIGQNIEDVNNMLNIRFNKEFRNVKTVNINYMCVIIPKNDEDALYCLRDLNKIHTELLKYVYRLICMFIYDTHNISSDEIRVYTRIYTDTYGIMYFKIEHINLYNYYIIRERSHDKEIDINLLIHNLETYSDYYQNYVFEYNLRYSSYLTYYNDFANYFGDVNKIDIEVKNKINIERQLAIIKKQEITYPLKRTRNIRTTCTNKWRNAQETQKTQDIYMSNLNEVDKTNCDNICFICRENGKILVVKKENFNILRFIYHQFDKMYSLLCKCNNKFYILTIEPIHLNCSIEYFLSSLTMSLLFNNNTNFYVYKGVINRNSLYYNNYIVKNIIHLDEKSYKLFCNGDKYIGLVNILCKPHKKWLTLIRYENPTLIKQIDAHLTYNIKNHSDSDAVKILKLYQKIYLGIEELIIKINDTHKYNFYNFFYVTKNKKFILIPDIKWLDADNIEKQLEQYKKDGVSHFTLWYNIFDEYIVEDNNKFVPILWNKPIKYENKYYMNPLNFMKIIYEYKKKYNTLSDINYDLMVNINYLYDENMEIILKICYEYIRIALIHPENTKFIKTYILTDSDISEFINKKNITDSIINEFSKIYENNVIISQNYVNWCSKNIELTKLIFEFYSTHNLHNIYKKQDVIHNINYLNEKNIVLFTNNDNQTIREEVENNFLKKTKVYENDIQILSYIHRLPGFTRYILHLHFVTAGIKIVESQIFEIKYNTVLLSDFEYNIKLDPNYYNRVKAPGYGTLNYRILYTNITDAVNINLYNYPTYPTFSLKTLKLDDLNIIYPKKSTLTNYLDIDYISWKENKHIRSFYINIQDLEYKMRIICKYIHKQVELFVNYYYKSYNTVKIYNINFVNKLINNFANEFIGIDMTKLKFKFKFKSFDNIQQNINVEKNKLITVLYNSLNTVKTSNFINYHWLRNSTIQFFYEDYCKKFNEIQKYPFTFSEWIINENIQKIFITKEIFEYHMKDCDYINKKFIDDSWNENDKIRNFYEKILKYFNEI